MESVSVRSTWYGQSHYHRRHKQEVKGKMRHLVGSSTRSAFVVAASEVRHVPFQTSR